MASRSGGDATSQEMEWRKLIFTDGDRRVVQVRLGCPRQEQDRRCRDRGV